MRFPALLAALALAGLPALPAASAAPLPALEGCFFLIDFPDHGHGLCVDPDGPCYVAYARTTFAGEVRTCVLPPGA